MVTASIMSCCDFENLTHCRRREWWYHVPHSSFRYFWSSHINQPTLALFIIVSMYSMVFHQLLSPFSMTILHQANYFYRTTEFPTNLLLPTASILHLCLNIEAKTRGLTFCRMTTRPSVYEANFWIVSISTSPLRQVRISFYSRLLIL